VEPVAPAYAREIKAPNANGAIIAEMSQRSDAYAAGLQPGDIITAVNGQTVSDPAHLMRLLANADVGSRAVIRVWRDGRTLEVRVPIVSASRTRR
jgi:serine protease Do